jgi:hypothetical protein
MLEMIKASDISHRRGCVKSLLLSNRVYTPKAQRDIKNSYLKLKTELAEIEESVGIKK